MSPSPRPETPTTRQPWSIRLGRLAGIPIRLHLTFVLLVAWIAIAYSRAGLGPTATVTGVLLVLAVFACVVIHELGHALMARRFGVHTREILLLPIGGIASLERIPSKPSQELAVALVGPAINVGIAAVLFAIGSVIDAGLFVTQLMWINLILAGFNLLPAFPMDGGRALRAVLAMRMSHLRATDVAAGLGKALAVGFGIIGFMYNIWLVLIAVVVWMGARHEAMTVKIRAALVDLPVSAAMNRHVEPVRSDDSLGEAARLLVSTGQNQLPIVERGETVGVLTRTDVADGIKHAGATAAVAEAPHHDAITVAPQDPLEGVFDRLAHQPGSVAVVVDRGKPIGIVTAEQLATFVALHAQHPTVSR